MAKILCFCASNSQKSLNHNLLAAACDLADGHDKTYAALRDILSYPNVETAVNHWLKEAA